MKIEKNLHKFRESLKGSYAGALITPGSNLFYLTGLDPGNVMERLFIAVIYPDKNPILILPKLFEDEIENVPIDFSEIYIWKDTDNPSKLLNDALHQIKDKEGKLLIEDYMPAKALMNVQNKIVSYSWNSLDSEMEKFRKIKSEDEIKKIDKAAMIADKTYQSILNEEIKGKTEKEVASLIDYILKKHGADETSFETIVASGPNSAKPHHTPSERKLQKNDIVIMDFGAKYKGYCSDISRTVAIDSAPKEAKKIFNIVREAQSEAKKIVKAGIEARSIDQKARDIIKENGYGDNFTHRVGHSLGLDAHEGPYLTGDNRETIEKNMIFTIEPGIYLKGRFGVRIEDDIRVKEKTGESLTDSRRDLVKL